MVSYATRRDVYELGLPRGTLRSDARVARASNPATDTIELDEHGFETNDRVLVRALEDGALPAPLQASTVYYAIRVSDSTLQLAAAESGPAIDLTSTGDGIVLVAPLPIERVLEAYSRVVEDWVPHLVPFVTPYPTTIVMTVAELSARKLQLMSGQISVSMQAIEEAAQKRLERWASGIPIRDDRATKSSNLAVVARGASWCSRGGPRLP